MFSRPDEIIERDIKTRPYFPKSRFHLITEFQRLEVLLLCPLIYILRMLVVAHQKSSINATHAFIARNDVGSDLLIGTAGIAGGGRRCLDIDAATRRQDDREGAAESVVERRQIGEAV